MRLNENFLFRSWQDLQQPTETSLTTSERLRCETFIGRRHVVVAVLPLYLFGSIGNWDRVFILSSCEQIGVMTEAPHSADGGSTFSQGSYAPSYDQHVDFTQLFVVSNTHSQMVGRLLSIPLMTFFHRHQCVESPLDFLACLLHVNKLYSICCRLRTLAGPTVCFRAPNGRLLTEVTGTADTRQCKMTIMYADNNTFALF